MRKFEKVTLVKYSDRKNFVMRYEDPATGKIVARSAGTPDRRAALRAAAKWEAELATTNKASANPRIQWSAFRERYETDVYPGLAPKTRQLIDTVFDRVEQTVRPKKLADLDDDRLSYLQQQLREADLSAGTIRTYFAHLRSALNWAARLKLLARVPEVTISKRGMKAPAMKGRPISEAEFSALLEQVEAVAGPTTADAWRRLLSALWLSGLRLGEALNLSWDPLDGLHVVEDGEDLFLSIFADHEKGNRDRLLPISPEFCEFLRNTPVVQRSGKVLPLLGRRGQARKVTVEWASSTIAKMGAAANIVVKKNSKTGKLKYASAQDLRRSFGERWARRVMPVVLKELMRHESIETTLKFYVGVNAKETARVLREASAKG